MRQFGQWVLAVADSIGGPGLFLIAFLDSSFLSFPQANDLLIVLKVAQHRELGNKLKDSDKTVAEIVG